MSTPSPLPPPPPQPPSLPSSGLKIEREGNPPWLIRAGSAEFQFVKITLPLADLPAGLEGYSFLFLSDLHLRVAWEPVLDGLLEKFRAAKPQAVLIGGDLVEDKHDHRKALPALRRLLGSLPTPHGTYAILGNHDGPRLQGNLKDAPIEYVEHRRVLIGPAASPIEVIGLNGFKKPLPAEKLQGYPPRSAGIPRIVLCHYPFLIRRVAPALDPDIYLAGHTHGGQVCLPDGRPLLTHDRLPKKYAADLHRWKRTWFLVSRGLGFSQYQVRAFCPPEAHLIELRRS